MVLFWADFFVGEMQEKEKNIRRLAERFFRLPHGSLKADPSGTGLGQVNPIGGQIGSEIKDPFAAADIHDCNGKLEELRGDR